MDIRYNLFPGGKRKALTMSYDDGRDHDRRLVEIFNRYGIRGTFHLTSDSLGKERYITAEEVPTLFRGHEVSGHAKTHPFLEQLPVGAQLQELFESRKALEKLCGYPVRGMSWPFGTYSDEAVNTAKVCGMEYSRTVISTGKLRMPEDFLRWHPTTHHRGNLTELWGALQEDRRKDLRLLYIWGHSYEFEDNQNWDYIEEFCRLAGGKPDIWYATNIEIKEYWDTLQRLVFSADLRRVYNPSATDAWFSADGVPVCLAAGKTVSL
jgi:hypothetical protein